MNPTPGGFAPPMQTSPSKDESDLNLLSILHYCWGGLLGCTTLGMVGYFVLLGGVFGVSAAEGGGDAGGAAVAAGFTIVIGVVMGVVMAALATVHFLAAAG